MIQRGKHSYGEPIVRGDISNVYIGNYTSIAQGVVFDCGFHHNTDFISTFPFNAIFNRPEITTHPKTKGDIIIGSDVWIGEGSMIMGGVTIGDGAVIGARSVVTRDVMPFHIVAGSPAKHKKFRHIAYQVSYTKWWEWEDEKVKEFIPYLMSNNVEQFLKKHNERNPIE